MGLESYLFVKTSAEMESVVQMEKTLSSDSQDGLDDVLLQALWLHDIGEPGPASIPAIQIIHAAIERDK